MAFACTHTVPSAILNSSFYYPVSYQIIFVFFCAIYKTSISSIKGLINLSHFVYICLLTIFKQYVCVKEIIEDDEEINYEPNDHEHIQQFADAKFEKEILSRRINLLLITQAISQCALLSTKLHIQIIKKK